MCIRDSVNSQLLYDLSQVVRYFSLTSPSPLLAKRWAVFGFAFFKSSDVICRGAIKLWSDHVLSAGNNCRPDVVLILLHRQRSQALCRLPRPVYGDASRAWCTTWVFAFERGFRSRVLSPTPNALKIRKRWITCQPRLTQIHCWRLGGQSTKIYFSSRGRLKSRCRQTNLSRSWSLGRTARPAEHKCALVNCSSSPRNRKIFWRYQTLHRQFTRQLFLPAWRSLQIFNQHHCRNQEKNRQKSIKENSTIIICCHCVWREMNAIFIIIPAPPIYSRHK